MRNRRRTFRMNVPSDCTSAWLTVGGRKVRVRLTDESAGGFCVTTKSKITCRPAQIVELRTSRGRFEARVIYNRTINSETNIGLELCAELSLEDRPNRLSTVAMFLVVVFTSMILFRMILFRSLFG